MVYRVRAERAVLRIITSRMCQQKLNIGDGVSGGHLVLHDDLNLIRTRIVLRMLQF